MPAICIDQVDITRIKDIALLHKEVLGDSFLAQLGLAFLTRLYGGLIRDPSFFAYCASLDGRPAGFIAITTDAEGYFGRVCKANVLPFTLAIFRAMVRKPSLCTRVCRVLVTQVPDPRPAGKKAELLSIAVREEAQGQGVGGALLDRALSDLKEQGHRSLSVIVDAGISSNQFYMKRGFTLSSSFSLHGDQANLYLRDFS